jgi:hypothetical protein
VTPCNPATVLAAMLAKLTATHAPYGEFYIEDIDSPALAAQFAGWPR